MKPVYEEHSCLLLYHEEQTEFANVVSDVSWICTADGLRVCRLDADLIIPMVSGCEITRYLDQYYLVLSTVDAGLRQDTIDKFFSFLAPRYEEAVDVRRNEENIGLLLTRVQAILGGPDQSVLLDFGCGPGVSLPVAFAHGVSVLGFDTSAAMLRAAQARGMRTISAERLLSSEALCFDGIIASYVLHLEPAEVWLRAAWSHVRPGGILAGNFHKDKGIESFIKHFDVGGGTMEFISPPNSERHGRYVICTKS